MKLFLIFAMQSHGGNIKKCDCIGRFFLCTRVAWLSENNAVQKNPQPWWQPDHRIWFKTTHWTSSLHQFWWCNTPCPNHGKVPQPSDCRETTSFKKHPFSPKFMECMNLRILTHGKKSTAIFDPVNSGLSLPWFSLNLRGRECILVYKQCEFLLFHQFSHKIVTKHSPFFVSSFPMQLKTCNKQPNMGESRP